MYHVMSSSNRLTHLQHVASTEFVRHNKATADAIEAYLACGAALSEAKASCKHGEWLPWLGATGIPKRTAQRMMALHAAGLKSDMVTYFGGIGATLDALPALRALRNAGRIWRRCEGLSDEAIASVLRGTWLTQQDAFDEAWFMMWQLGESPDGPIPRTHDSALLDWVVFYKSQTARLKRRA